MPIRPKGVTIIVNRFLTTFMLNEELRVQSLVNLLYCRLKVHDLTVCALVIDTLFGQGEMKRKGGKGKKGEQVPLFRKGVG